MSYCAGGQEVGVNSEYNTKFSSTETPVGKVRQWSDLL